MKNANNDNDTWISIGVQAALILNRFKTTAALTEHASDTEKPNQKENPTGYPEKENRNAGQRRALA